MGSKQFYELEADLDAYWGLINPRRISTVADLKRELAMEQPNFIYIYVNAEQQQIVLDLGPDAQQDNLLDLSELAKWLKKEALRPLLIITWLGDDDAVTIPGALYQQTRFIWLLNTKRNRYLDEMNKLVSRVIEGIPQQPDLISLIDTHKAQVANIVTSHVKYTQKLMLMVDAQSQREAQQFRAALLRIMLGRENLKGFIGQAIQRHLGNPENLIYAVTGSALSCVFELPQQVSYRVAPNLINQQGIILVNHPLHLRPQSQQNTDSISAAICDELDQTIQQGRRNLEDMIEKTAQQKAMTAYTGAIVFQWNLHCEPNYSEADLEVLLPIWQEIIAYEFGNLYTPNAGIIHALCLRVADHDQVERLHRVTQKFLREKVRGSPMQKPILSTPPLGTLDALEIDDFFQSDESKHWADYFKFVDHNIDSYDFAEWVCQQTNGEFESVVTQLWAGQQTKYAAFLTQTL